MLKEIIVDDDGGNGVRHYIRPVVFTIDELKHINCVNQFDEIGINSEVFDSFLAIFFEKYYDNSLWCNSEIARKDIKYPKYVWDIDNFYTYVSINKMCDEILEIADLLENDYNNPKLSDIKRRFDFCLQCKMIEECPGRDKCPLSIKESTANVVRFYRKFVNQTRELMKNNAQSSIGTISAWW